MRKKRAKEILNNIMYDNMLRQVITLYIIIYARLSKEEENKSEEEQSSSIQHQLELCRQFIEEEKQTYPNINYVIVKELYDDGISGTTFDRDDFNKLVKLIEENKANMVITKDLSRLGRDHVATDNYIEKWFPEHNTRYVSIIEGIDTYDGDSISNDIAPIINWSNDQFAKTTSKKIRREFAKMRMLGAWTGGEPPIGYKLDPKNTNHFVVDEKGAEIVKRIFNLALSGKSKEEISAILTKEKVPIPTVLKGYKRKFNQEIVDLWSADTIGTILKNEMYLGHMVQGKTTRLNYKSNKIIYLPPEDWIVVKNTHEPIISQSTFDSVQLLFQSNKNKTTNTYDYLLRGLLVCNECHHHISIQTYSTRNKNYTVCNYYRKYGSKKKVCTAHRFNYEELEKMVIDSIRQECKQLVNYTDFANKLKDKHEGEQLKLDIKLNIEKTKRELEKVTRQVDTIYEDKLNGVITDEQYKRMSESKNQELARLSDKLKSLESDYDGILSKNIKTPDYIKIVKEFLSIKNPNKIIVGKLIDVIYVSADGTIDIHYKFTNPYK